MKATSKLHGRGKVTVPATIREALALEDGDYVELEIKPIEEGNP